MEERSYANAAKDNETQEEPPVAFVADEENVLPGRPLTTSINPRG